MKKVGIIIDNGYHDLEFWIPYYRLKEEHIDFDVLAFEDREYSGVYKLDSVRPTMLIGENLVHYDMIYIPGANSPANLLKNPMTVEIVKNISKNTKFATICHAPIILAEAGLLVNKQVTGHPSIKDEIERKNAIYVDRPVIRTSDTILSAKTHFQMDQFMPQLLEFIRE
ncbi:MAG: DJ-1/PfpI family protein [Thermoplasmata archaeon]